MKKKIMAWAIIDRKTGALKTDGVYSAIYVNAGYANSVSMSGKNVDERVIKVEIKIPNKKKKT